MEVLLPGSQSSAEFKIYISPGHKSKLCISTGRNGVNIANYILSKKLSSMEITENDVSLKVSQTWRQGKLLQSVSTKTRIRKDKSRVEKIQISSMLYSFLLFRVTEQMAGFDFF